MAAFPNVGPRAGILKTLRRLANTEKLFLDFSYLLRLTTVCYSWDTWCQLDILSQFTKFKQELLCVILDRYISRHLDTCK